MDRWRRTRTPRRGARPRQGAAQDHVQGTKGQAGRDQGTVNGTSCASPNEMTMFKPSGERVHDNTVSQAYFALHETLHKGQNSKEIIFFFFFGTKVTSEAFLSISQNLKVIRLQGGTQTKL